MSRRNQEKEMLIKLYDIKSIEDTQEALKEYLSDIPSKDGGYYGDIEFANKSGVNLSLGTPGVFNSKTNTYDKFPSMYLYRSDIGIVEYYGRIQTYRENKSVEFETLTKQGPIFIRRKP